jgi:outer membrane murein-binding lipoprotein Lpp
VQLEPDRRLAFRISAAIVATVLLCGCIDSSRVNDTCSWSDSVARRLDLTQRDDREHLRQDAEIANELMVRFGDAHLRHNPEIQRPFRDRCISATIDSIVARHGVTRADFHAAERMRVWWADFLIVFLPLGVLTVLAMDAATRRVCRSFDPEDRVPAAVSLFLLVPVVAVLALAVMNFWSFSAEGFRLRDGHLSNRAFLIPVVTHGWLAYAATLVICAGTAIARFRRTPLTGGRQPIFARASRVGRVISKQPGRS